MFNQKCVTQKACRVINRKCGLSVELLLESFQRAKRKLDLRPQIVRPPFVKVWPLPCSCAKWREAHTCQGGNVKGASPDRQQAIAQEDLSVDLLPPLYKVPHHCRSASSLCCDYLQSGKGKVEERKGKGKGTGKKERERKGKGERKGKEKKKHALLRFYTILPFKSRFPLSYTTQHGDNLKPISYLFLKLSIKYFQVVN